MPSITAIPQPMLMPRYEPLASLLRMVCATTPTPNAIRMKVPKNSAAASRAVPLSMRGILALIELQHDDVLPRQDFDHAVDGKALSLHLLLHFGHAHLVHFEDRDLRILLAEFQQHEAAIGLERVLE